MKTGMKRVSAFLMGAVLLIGTAGCSKGNKKFDKMKEKAERTVKEYFDNLSTGNIPMLSNYCDPENDRFQDIKGMQIIDDSTTSESSDYENVYPQQDYLVYWYAYLNHVKVEPGEFTLDGDKGTIEVKLSIIDSQKALSFSGQLDEVYILRYLTEAYDYTSKTVLLSLDCDPDEETCKIKTMQMVFNEVKKQFDIVIDMLPKKNNMLEDKLFNFMSRLITLDTDYLSDSAFDLGVDISSYANGFKPLYQAMLSCCTYEYEVSNIKGGNAEFDITIHKKDEENALYTFTCEPKNWGPSYEKILTYAVHAPQNFDAQEDLRPVAPVASGFSEQLKMEADQTFTVHAKFKKDSSATYGYSVKGDFHEVFPAVITGNTERCRLPSFTERYLEDVCRSAVENLRKYNAIKPADYFNLRNMLYINLSPEKYSEVMKNHNFTQTKENVDGYNNYSRDGRFIITTTKYEDMDHLLDSSMSDYTLLESLIADGTYTGTLSGGWVFYEHRGQMPDNGTMTDVYTRSLAFSTHTITIQILKCTDADLQELLKILKELGLE
ncbi:MAG: hypothetical protein J6Y58_04835 [Clostridiales bacterium]|nr:hypothetical protein [Clostridiales bacterium]